MIWQSETMEQRLQRLRKWHPYFTWWPKIMGDGRVFWLETIERRLIDHYQSLAHGGLVMQWEYRYPVAPRP